MRLFVAVPIPEELKKRIAEVQEKISGKGDIKLVEKQNLHFTIKFLGDAPEEKVAGIKTSIEKACANTAPFDIAVAGIAAFPSRNYARVIWLSVKEGYQQFEKLIKDVDAEFENAGFEKELEHVPHLTVARVRSGRNKPELLKALQALEQTEIGKMRICEVKLMKSKLSRAGPVYEEVYSVKLK